LKTGASRNGAELSQSETNAKDDREPAPVKLALLCESRASGNKNVTLYDGRALPR